jgi:DNA polymerase-1
LGLKSQSQEFSGNYAEEDIHDITLIHPDSILPYNLVDCLSTWYVNEKNKPIMIMDQQNAIYQDLFKPSARDIIHMQLVGLPIDMERVKEVQVTLQKDEDDAAARMKNHPLIKAYIGYKVDELVIERNLKLKTKARGKVTPFSIKRICIYSPYTKQLFKPI